MSKRKKYDDLYVSVSLTAVYRSTIEFFALKDSVVADYYQKPFPHWMRADNLFSLIEPDNRRVIRFEAGRFIVKAEGHPTMTPFEELMEIARNCVDRFKIKDLFAVAFTSRRSMAMNSLEEARSNFDMRFLAEPSRRILDVDASLDFGLILERTWPSTINLKKLRPTRNTALNNKLAKLNIHEYVAIGPASYMELAQKGWVEFKKDAENQLYKVQHEGHKASIFANMKFDLNRRGQEESLPIGLLWDFYELAQQKSEAAWLTIKGE